MPTNARVQLKTIGFYKSIIHTITSNIIISREFASSICYVAWPSDNNLLIWNCFRVNPLLSSSVVSQAPLLHLRLISTIKHIQHSRNV
jgi:hypothetical protein